MSRYAEGTTVSVERSIDELRRLLTNNGATHYAYGKDPDGEIVQFAIAEHFYRFTVKPPAAVELRATYVGDDWRAEIRACQINWGIRVEAELRRRWRARVLWLKSVLEFMEQVPLEESLLSNLVLPDGRTFGGWAAPQVESMYATGGMPPLLSAGAAR